MIALLNAIEPLALAPLQSNPIVFVAEISLPVAFSIVGSSPSNPSWKGKTNFLCAFADIARVIASAAVDSCVSPRVVASSQPNIFSSEKTTLLPVKKKQVIMQLK